MTDRTEAPLLPLPDAHEWRTPNRDGTWTGHLGYARPRGAGYQYDGPLFRESALLAAIAADRASRVSQQQADIARLVEDRARFPDRPDDIGNMIAAHYANLKAKADANETAWRAAQLKADVAAQELERLLTGIVEIAMRLAKDKGYRIRASEDLLKLAEQFRGDSVVPTTQPSGATLEPGAGVVREFADDLRRLAKLAAANRGIPLAIPDSIAQQMHAFMLGKPCLFDRIVGASAERSSEGGA